MYVEKKQTGGKVEMVMTKQNQLKTEKNKIKSMLITLVNSSTSMFLFTIVKALTRLRFVYTSLLFIFEFGT